MSSLWRRVACAVLFCLLLLRAWAGGSGLNLLVVANQNSSNSVQLANYYCEKRQVPPQNYLRINWPGGNIEWTNSDYQTYLLNPLMSMLSTNRLTNQIDYVVLSMDIPYRVKLPPDFPNSTTSTLFYGFKPQFDPCFPYDVCIDGSLVPGSTSAYAGSEGIFRTNPPVSAGSNSFLVMMITSTSLAQAKAVVDQGIASDNTFPSQTVYLAKSSDRLRNIRYASFDNTVFDARLRGNYTVQRTNIDNPSFTCCIQGYENGIGIYTIGTNVFAPGAMADDLTSFGGWLFENSGQTPLTAFLNAGATASHGTVWEPGALLEKFPSPQTYFYQSRGFSAAECYYQSITNPYQGLLVGEPLAAPFAIQPGGVWSNLPVNAVLSGVTNLLLQCIAADANHPIGQVDLFVDGLLSQTITNIPPRQGNLLSVSINGHLMSATVLANASLKSTVTQLVATINAPANTVLTGVSAAAHGDRIELQGTATNKPGAGIPLSVASFLGSAPVLETRLAASGTNLLDTVAYGYRGYVITNNSGVATLPLGSYLQLAAIKTNGQTVICSVTNSTSTNLAGFARALFDMVNTNTSLVGPDGIVVEDVNMHEDEPFATYIYGEDDHSGEFNVRVQTAGWQPAAFQVRITGSSIFTISPSVTNTLDPNYSDLQARAHIYVTSGLTNLLLTFPFNTTNQSDGFHELAAVIYEGSHVRTQKRVAETVKIQNLGLSAVFTTLVGDTNTAVEATLQFSVVANTNNISKIELFSTGGSLGSVLGQATATFSVPGSSLDVGLHPFFAIVTRSDGKQYRTETKWIRLVGPDSPFNVAISAPPPALAWPASAGRSYDVLTSSVVTGSYQLSATVVPTNSAARWIDSNPVSQRFYRVRTSN